MDKLLKDLKKLRKDVSNKADKSWIWNTKEIQALDLIIKAVEDCV